MVQAGGETAEGRSFCGSDHALVTAEYYQGDGWCVEPFDFSLKYAWLKVHAWADLEPYKGE